MAGLTQAQAQANLDAANAAYLKAVYARSYAVGNKSKVNQEIKVLRGEIAYWSAIVESKTRGGIQVRGMTAR
jgi:uncharacterized membrane-anchored protein